MGRLSARCDFVVVVDFVERVVVGAEELVCMRERHPEQGRDGQGQETDAHAAERRIEAELHWDYSS